MSAVKTLLVSCCFASLAFAQEIGTEITPSTPSSGVKPAPATPAPATPAPNENPYAQPAPQPAPQPQAQPQQTGGYVYRPQGQKATSAPAANNASTASGARAEPTVQGPKVSASAGDFGIRAGFGASGSVALPSGTSSTSTVAVGAPSVGISYFATDGFKLTIDLGFGLALLTGSSSAAWALNANLGFDYLFRSPGDALRPLFHFAAQFGMAGAGSGDFNPSVGFGVELGGGAEYFFSPSFSVYGRIGLAVPMAVPGGNFILGIFTFTPGVGASFYF